MIINEDVKLIHGDCLEVMKTIPDDSIDLILCDLPYGTTRNKWDSVIDLAALWTEYKRVCCGAIVLTAQTPFDKVLGASNIDMLRYEWIWRKEAGTGFLNAKRAPLKDHENVLVFYGKPPTYNPQMRTGFKPYRCKKGGRDFELQSVWHRHYRKQWRKIPSNSVGILARQGKAPPNAKASCTHGVPYQNIHQ